MQVSLFEAAGIARWQMEYIRQILLLQYILYTELQSILFYFVKVHLWLLLRKWSSAVAFSHEIGNRLCKERKWDEHFDVVI